MEEIQGNNLEEGIPNTLQEITDNKSKKRKQKKKKGKKIGIVTIDKNETTNEFNEVVNQESERDKLRRIYKTKLNAMKFNREPLTEDKIDYDDKGNIVGRKIKQVYTVKEDSDSSKIVKMFNMIRKDPSKLEKFVKKSGMNMDQLQNTLKICAENENIESNKVEIQEIEDII
jgi:hypothetical protein